MKRYKKNMDFKWLEELVILICFLLLFITLPISIWFCFLAIKEYQRVVIFRMGRIKEGGPRGPGIVFILPCTDNYFIIDQRVVTFDVPAQQILTKDSVTVFVDAVIYYKVINFEKAIIAIADFMYSTEQLGATTLRNILGTKRLHEILEDKDSLSSAMQIILDEATAPWGVKVERVEIKDVSLPESMQRAMAAAGEATREAKAKVIAAEGELLASRALKNASDIIAKNPATLQLRYLQTLNTISTEQNETIVFPLPLDIIRKTFKN